MKVLDADCTKGFMQLSEDGWQHNYHERNGGNLSYRMKPEEVEAVREVVALAAGEVVPLPVGLAVPVPAVLRRLRECTVVYDCVPAASSVDAGEVLRASPDFSSRPSGNAVRPASTMRMLWLGFLLLTCTSSGTQELATKESSPATMRVVTPSNSLEAAVLASATEVGVRTKKASNAVAKARSGRAVVVLFMIYPFL